MTTVFLPNIQIPNSPLNI